MEQDYDFSEMAGKAKQWHQLTPYPCLYPDVDDLEAQGIYDVLPDIFELEEYMVHWYLDSYIEKISYIVLKLISLYKAEVFIAEYPDWLKHKELSKHEHQNIRCWGIWKIHDVISEIIRLGETYLSVYFPAHNSLIEIGYRFDTSVYSENEEFMDKVKILVPMEGLHLLLIENTYEIEDEQKKLTEG